MPRAPASRVSSRVALREQVSKVYHPASGERNQAADVGSTTSYSFSFVDDPSPIAVAHSRKYGHLPVDAQISALLADNRAKSRRLRDLERRALHQSLTPPGPRRKPLPPPIPLATPLTLAERIARDPPPPSPPRLPLAKRISARPLPEIPAVGHRPIDIDFAKKQPHEVELIFDSRLGATITRLTIIWELKDLWNDLSFSDQCALEDLGKRLNWASRNSAKAHTWLKIERDSLSWGLQSIGHIKFEQLRKNYASIVKKLVFVYSSGYFDWIGCYL